MIPDSLKELVASVRTLHNRIQMNADVLDVSLSRWGRPLIQLNSVQFLELFKGRQAEEIILATGNRILRLVAGEGPEAVTFIMSEKTPAKPEKEPHIVTV